MQVFQPQVFLKHNCTLQGNQNKYQPNKLQILKNKLSDCISVVEEKHEGLARVPVLLWITSQASLSQLSPKMEENTLSFEEKQI